MKPKISIIILNYNGWKDTIECLESIYKISYPNYEVIVIDNNSENDSLGRIKKWTRGRIKYIEYTKKELESGEYLNKKKRVDKLHSNQKLFVLKNDKNYGFAEGNNIGINQVLKEKNSKYVLFLNNDTIVDENFLTDLVKTAENENNVGITSGIIYNYFTKKIECAGGKINWCLASPIIYQKYKEQKTEFISGCLMLIPLNVIKSLRGFDKDYFFYFEDADLCERVKNIGKNLYINKKSKIFHKNHQTSKFKSEFYIYNLARSRIIFNKKHNKNIFKYYIFIFLQYIVKTIGAYIYLDKNGFKAWIRGIKGL